MPVTDDFKKDDVKWVVTEKIHGANFSVYYDGTTVQFAKRNSFVNWLTLLRITERQF